MLKDGRELGSFTTVPKLRSCRMLRFLHEQTRDEALSTNHTPNHPIIRTRRALAMVLPR